MMLGWGLNNSETHPACAPWIGTCIVCFLCKSKVVFRIWDTDSQCVDTSSVVRSSVPPSVFCFIIISRKLSKTDP